MSIKRSVPACVAFALALGCTSAGGSQQAEVDGARVYANNCNRCHEYRSPTEFTGPQWSVITTHMRVVGGIPADEARAVYEYLKAQHHPAYVAAAPPSAAPVPAEPSVGKSLVQQNGCIGCHVIEGRGGTMGPPLDGVASRRSQDFVLQQLLDPRANKASGLMPNLGLSRAEAQAIWAYLETLDGRDSS